MVASERTEGLRFVMKASSIKFISGVLHIPSVDIHSENFSFSSIGRNCQGKNILSSCEFCGSI